MQAPPYFSFSPDWLDWVVLVEGLLRHLVNPDALHVELQVVNLLTVWSRVLGLRSVMGIA